MLCSCGSTKIYDYVEYKEVPKEAVNIAIADFSSALQRQKDTNIVAVRVGIAYTSTDWFYITMIPWIDETNKFPVEMLDMYMGQIPLSHIPTEYIKRDNVLFVWHDPQQVLTQEIKEVLVNSNLVSYPEEDWFFSLDGTHLSYIFCKSKYKRKYYRKVFASYIVPLPSCRCVKTTGKE